MGRCCKRLKDSNIASLFHVTFFGGCRLSQRIAQRANKSVKHKQEQHNKKELCTNDYKLGTSDLQRAH